MKKRNKKYVRKQTRVPSIMYRLCPDLSKETRDDLDLFGFVQLDALRRGVGTLENADAIQATLCSAFVLAAAFEDKEVIQLLCQLGYAATGASKAYMKDGNPIPKALLDVAEMGVKALADMSEQCDRETLVRAARAGIDAHGRVIRIAPGSAFLIEPKFKEKDPLLKRLCNKRGATVINGKVRTGYVHRNAEMKRNEFIDPIEETTVPITEEIVLLLADPLKENDHVQTH